MTDDRNLSTEHQRKGDARKPSDTLDKNQPADAGARARIDPKTGEVRGAGVGAGGSSPGEDHDSDPQGGSGTLSDSDVSTRERSGAADE